MEFVRPFDVYNTKETTPVYWARYVTGMDGKRAIDANVALTENECQSGIHHITGRACPRGGGPLRDSIIHFGESLPVNALQEGWRRAAAAPLNLVVGSSLLVSPAKQLPFAGKSPVAIVSKSCTGSDLAALRSGGVLLRADADQLLERLVQHARLSMPNTPAVMEGFATRVRARDEAVLRSDGDMPYEGGADGGVFPDAWVQRLLTPASPGTAVPAAVVAPATAIAPKSAAAPALVSAALVLRQTWEATTQKDGENLHRWSLGVETPEGDTSCRGAVASVRFELHPTFKPSVYEIDKSPFHIGPFIGWGTFEVGVTIREHSGRSHRISFPLKFNQSETILPIPSSAKKARGAGA